MAFNVKQFLWRELKVLLIWLAVYFILMVLLIFLALMRVPSEEFVRTFNSFLPMVLLVYLPYFVIRLIALVVGIVGGLKVVSQEKDSGKKQNMLISLKGILSVFFQNMNIVQRIIVGSSFFIIVVILAWAWADNLFWNQRWMCWCGAVVLIGIFEYKLFGIGKK